MFSTCMLPAYALYNTIIINISILSQYLELHINLSTVQSVFYDMIIIIIVVVHSLGI